MIDETQTTNAIQIDTEFETLIPPLHPEELALLEQSLLDEGCRDPLTVWGDLLIDGHNRYRICQRHGIPFDTVQHDFDSRVTAILWIIRNQLGRRNLTDYERGRLALRGKEALAARAKANMSIAGQDGAKSKWGLTNLSNPIEAINTRQELATASNVSQGTLAAIQRVETAAPEPIKLKARRGELSIHRADVLTKAINAAMPRTRSFVVAHDVDDPELVKWLSQGEADGREWFNELTASGYIQPGEEVEAVPLASGLLALQKAVALRQKLAARIINEVRIEAAHEAARQQAGDEAYSVVYADPAWEYSNSGIGAAAARQYLTMPTEDICTLLQRQGVKLTSNAVLFLWATNPLLPDALQVMTAWGFEYKTNMVWVKGRNTGGFYVSGGHELLLIGVRGQMRPSVISSSVIAIPATTHSRKPAELYKLIESMYPDQRYIEMFARKQSPRNRWTFWGNEAESDDVNQ